MCIRNVWQEEHLSVHMPGEASPDYRQKDEKYQISSLVQGFGRLDFKHCLT